MLNKKRKEGLSMNEDTRQLLQECTAGCKMAVESIHQVAEYVQDEKLLQIMENYKKKHKQVDYDGWL